MDLGQISGELRLLASYSYEVRSYRSVFATVIGPMQQSLPLTGAAKGIPRLTVLQDRGDMPPESLPALDRTPIFFRQLIQ